VDALYPGLSHPRSAAPAAGPAGVISSMRRSASGSREMSAAAMFAFRWPGSRVPGIGTMSSP
jgi:hypothetical protein